MVDVTTPDGRTLTLPRSIVPASMLPQQEFAAGMPGAVPFGAPPPQPVEFAQPMLAPPADPLVPGVVEMGEPETQNVTVMDPLEVAARPAAMKKMAAQQAQVQAQQAAYAASPEGKLDAAQKQQTSALDAEIAARQGAADIQSAEDTVLHEAEVTRNKQLDELRDKGIIDAQKNADAVDAKIAEVGALKRKIANTKIDRSVDHPIMAAVGVALGVLGAGIKGGDGSNPALDMLFKTIDRKVDAQMQDLDLMGKIYGMTKEEIDMLKDKSKSRLEFYNMMYSAEVDKAVRHVSEITSRSASQKTQASAKIVTAQLQARGGEKEAAAAQWGMDFDQKDKHQKEQQKTARYGISVQDRHNRANEKFQDDTLQFQREKAVLDRDEAMAKARAQGGADGAKMLADGEEATRKYGIKGADNKYMLNKEGREKMAVAETRELEATALEEQYKNDPMGSAIKARRVQVLRQSAAALRGEAASLNTVKFGDTTAATQTRTNHAARQNMINVVDKILTHKADRALIGKSVDQQELDGLYRLLAVKGKAAWALGAWDKGTAVLVKDIYGSNPAEWDSKTMRGWISDTLGDDPEGYKARLDAIAHDLEDMTRQDVQKNSDWDGNGELFSRVKAQAPSSGSAVKLAQAKSGLEADSVKPRVDRSNRPLGGPDAEKAAERANRSQSVKYPGLSIAQEAPFEDRLQAYKKGDKIAGDELIVIVTKTAEDRPDLAVPLLHNLEEHAQPLYRAARARLPKDGAADKQMTLEENNKIARAPIPPAELATMIINTMGADGRVTAEREYRELYDRAGKGDQDAKRAIADILSANSKKKHDNTLPRGSVFKGGR